MQKRSFLFLQGPQSRFLRRLGLALLERGQAVDKINFCGGDILHWPSPRTRWFQGGSESWPEWISRFMDRAGTTDLLLFGDRRPLIRDAILLARQRGIQVHVFEEGYLRPHYITMESDGVNGMSTLPRSPQEVREQAAQCPDPAVHPPIHNPLKIRVHDAIRHHVGNALFFWLFPQYRTHRPYHIGRELVGWLPRYLTRRQRKAKAHAKEGELLATGAPFFLFPLQLDTDFQIKLYSPFSGVRECIMEVLASFAAHAPAQTMLVLKNHPLDNGLIRYERFCRSMARALGIEDRVLFLEDGHNDLLISRCSGMVVINSTMGLSALGMGRPVYCLGQAVFRMQGLAAGEGEMGLDGFWRFPRPVDEGLHADFTKLLVHRALVYGDFYSDQGIAAAVQGCLDRFGLA